MQSSSGSNMISSAEARKLSDANRKQNELYLQDVFEQIRDQIKKGSYELLLYNRTLSCNDQEYLRANGFVVMESISYSSDSSYRTDSDGYTQYHYPPKVTLTSRISHYIIRW